MVIFIRQQIFHGSTVIHDQAFKEFHSSFICKFAYFNDSPEAKPAMDFISAPLHAYPYNLSKHKYIHL